MSICNQFGIDFPLFAFSHCRDVVAAVTNAGGFGVLGAIAYAPDQLDRELAWIDDAVGGKPYGVDLIVPAKFEGKGEKLSLNDLAERIPQGHRGGRDGAAHCGQDAGRHLPGHRSLGRPHG